MRGAGGAEAAGGVKSNAGRVGTGPSNVTRAGDAGADTAAAILGAAGAAGPHSAGADAADVEGISAGTDAGSVGVGSAGAAASSVGAVAGGAGADAGGAGAVTGSAGARAAYENNATPTTGKYMKGKEQQHDGVLLRSSNRKGKV